MCTLSSPSARKKHNNDRVWKLDELSVFHELQKPVSVVVSSVYEHSHSSQGLKNVDRFLFVNERCVEEYGEPRCQEECSRLLSSMSEDTQEKRRTWLTKAAMGRAGHQACMDSCQLLMPVFSGVSQESPSRMVRVDSKPIKVETMPGRVENALLHVYEAEQSSPTDLRVSAMHDRSPLHTFLFDSQGFLLTANKAALQFCQAGSDPSGPQLSTITLRSLFDLGSYPGGAEEAQAAYDEAVNAVFNLQVECHRHTQPHISKKSSGIIKWAMIEMWPMQDPVTGRPATLIKRYNISQQKELELQLASQQVALQRHNQELEQDSVAMHEEQRKLEREARSLALRLDAVLKDKFTPRTSFDADTPIDKTLKFLQKVIAGHAAPVEVALELYNILSESDTNLRQPVGLENQLMKNSLGSEVGQSILQLLQGNVGATPQAGPHVVAEGPFCMMKQHEGGPEAAAISGLSRRSSLTKRQLDVFIPANITPDVERRLHDAENNWQFDIFGFAEATKGFTLSLLYHHLMRQTGIIKEHGLDETNLCKYALKIESGYDANNPYHNSIHVASVLQMSHMLMCHGGVLKNRAMTRMQQIATYWSALVHDHEHGGVNNDFLIKTRHPLAVTYNDTSPLENHHCASAFRLLCLPEYTYYPVKSTLDAVVGPEIQTQMRSTTVNQVMGTDMKKHFDITSRFQAAFKRPVAGSGPEVTAVDSSMDWDAVKPEDRTLIEQMVLKCADIGHLAAAPRIHKKWAYQLEEEFFRQGDRERSCGLPLSPLMDRSTQGGMTRSQMGFFSIVGIPLFKAMAELFEESKPMLDGVLANYHHWEAATPDADLPP
ncbi:hypothetical protein ABBQ32_003454 [Trebouxia sp. C0010 RCD-2024]